MDCSPPGSFVLRYLLKFARTHVYIKLVMPSNHLILCHLLLLLPSIFPNIRIFSNDLARHISWSKYWSFSFSISPFSESSGLISFRTGWFVWMIPRKNVPAPWLVCHIGLRVWEGALWTNKQRSAKPGRRGWGWRGAFLRTTRGLLGRGGGQTWHYCWKGRGKSGEDRFVAFPAVPEVVCEPLRIIPWASCKVPRCSDLGTMGLPHWHFPIHFLHGSSQVLFLSFPPTLHYLPISFSPLAQPSYFYRQDFSPVISSTIISHEALFWSWPFWPLDSTLCPCFPWGQRENKKTSPSERSSVFSWWICLLNCESVIHGGHFSVLHEGPGQSLSANSVI